MKRFILRAPLVTWTLIAAAILISASMATDASAAESRKHFSHKAYANPQGSPPRHGYYGFAHKDYGWGWFGARYRGRMYSHRGYYGNTYQWGYRASY